jgi:cytoskeletal protein RodZ
LSRPPLSERPTGGFGAKLRDARERRGVSLRQIANATKISIAALEALERNDISRLPGGIFSRAFVRSYAVEVGLDPETTIQEFIAQFPNDSVTAGHPTSDQIEDHEAVESERRTAGTFLWLAVVSLPIAGAVVYFATSGRPVIGGAAQPPEAVAALPPADQTRPGGTPAAVEPAQASKTAQSAAPAEPAPSAAGTAAPSTPAPAGTAPTPGSEAAAGSEAATDRFSVQLAATRPCWVSAVVDGKKQIDRLMQTGERTTIDVHRELVLTAGDAEALKLTFNGAAARPLGTAGEVVSRRFTPANFRSYLQTR